MWQWERPSPCGGQNCAQSIPSFEYYITCYVPNMIDSCSKCDGDPLITKYECGGGLSGKPETTFYSILPGRAPANFVRIRATRLNDRSGILYYSYGNRD